MTDTTDTIEAVFSFESPTLFKMDSKGKIRSWRIEAAGDSYRTLSGLHGGKITVSKWSKCEPASQETAEEQAIFEAKAELKKKLDREYYDNLADAQSGVPKMFKPMLAKDYEKEGKKVDAYIASGGRLYIQPKLDGLRCVFTKAGGKSRQNQEYKSVAHITALLERFFERYPGAVLDGELYNHEFKAEFEKITSLARREEFNAEQLEQVQAMLQYHIYDGFLTQEAKDQPFLKRFSNVVRALTECGVELASGEKGGTINIVSSLATSAPDKVEKFHARFLEDGYEGTIIRMNVGYENKRTEALLKYKSFQTEEFKVLAVEEGNGNWSGAAKRIQIGNLDGSPFYDPDGKEIECHAGMRGTYDAGVEFLKDADKYIGGEVTIRYFGKTNGGLPRFPVAIDFHPEGRKD
tara:strand:- start:982 stop:2202 length:1221 start_codon:yes stop_codon:yes gene_type:complete